MVEHGELVFPYEVCEAVRFKRLQEAYKAGSFNSYDDMTLDVSLNNGRCYWGAVHGTLRRLHGAESFSSTKKRVLAQYFGCENFWKDQLEEKP